MPSKPWFPGWGDSNRDVEQFRGLKTQVDSLFEDWFGRSIGGVLAPRVDVVEDEKAVAISAELPGVKEHEIEVSLLGDELTIKGEKRSEHEEKKDEQGRVVHRAERSYGAFQRTITIPYKVEADQVSANFKDGVLTITLPKPADAVAQKQERKIEVNKPPLGSTGAAPTA
jgi:HSP20 family protein